jgi:hypothetical protein
MKGIYLTQEGKQEIEAKIAELEGTNIHLMKPSHTLGSLEGRISALKEILSSATILPVEESWNLSVVAITPFKQGLLKTLYKNGVIIKSKQ